MTCAKFSISEGSITDLLMTRMRGSEHTDAEPNIGLIFLPQTHSNNIDNNNDNHADENTNIMK